MNRFLLPAALLLLALAPAPALPEDGEGLLVVRAARLHLADGRSLADAVVILKEGRVAAVGSGLPVPRGARILEAPAACPGFADLRTGLDAGQDAEDPRPFGASLRMVDGFDPSDPAAAAAAREGVLRRLLLASDRIPLGGAAAVLRPAGRDALLAVATAEAGGSISLTGAATRRERHPGSPAGLLRALEAAFFGAVGAATGPFEGPDPELGMTDADRAAVAALAGGAASPTFLQATSRAEVRAALGLAGRHRLRPVLVGPRCGAVEVLDAAASAGVAPASLTVVLELDPDDPAFHLDSAAALAKAGVRIGFGTGGTRGPDALRLMTGLARRHGLDAAAARGALLGAGFDFLGRSAPGLAEGDPADLVLLDGDPADPASRVIRVVAGGELLRAGGGTR